MILVDSSIWVVVLRDGARRPVLETALSGAEPVLTRFTQLELLEGTRDEEEWDLLSRYLAVQDYLELDHTAWGAAARIHFDVRRRGSGEPPPRITCCVAQIAIDNDVLLLHDDPHFEVIAEVRDLRHRRLEL